MTFKQNICKLVNIELKKRQVLNDFQSNKNDI